MLKHGSYLEPLFSAHGNKEGNIFYTVDRNDAREQYLDPDNRRHAGKDGFHNSRADDIRETPYYLATLLLSSGPRNSRVVPHAHRPPGRNFPKSKMHTGRE